MIRIAICDDDAKFIKTEREIIEDYFAQKMLPYSIDCYFSGEELLKNMVQLGALDLIILDVEMKGKDGISVAKTIRERYDKVNIAFLSAHMNYSTDGYRVRAVRFILKNMDDLKAYLSECLDCVIADMDLIDKEITLNFTIGKRTLKISEIVCLKAKANYTVFEFLQEKSDAYLIRSSLKNLTNAMKTFDFISISSKETVNLRHIEAVSRYKVILDNGVEIPISQKKYNGVFRAYTLFRGKNA